METKTVTLKKINKHIKKCLIKNEKINFLGLVEQAELDRGIVDLFKYVTPTGYEGYDWVNGNDKMKKIIEIEKAIAKAEGE